MLDSDKYISFIFLSKLNMLRNMHSVIQIKIITKLKQNINISRYGWFVAGKIQGIVVQWYELWV